MFRLLAENDIEPLADAVGTVLEEVGILCQNSEMLAALRAMGAEVDFPAERVRFPRSMVREFVAGLEAQSATEPEADEPRRFQAPSAPLLETQVAPFVYDYDKQEHRRGRAEDFINLIKLGDVLHGDQGVGHCLVLADVPPLVEPLHAALLLAEYAHQPGPAFAWNVRQVEYLIEMGELLGLPNWYTLGATCIAHPLRFDRDVADRFVYGVAHGEAAGLTAMPVAGMTTPVTVEGFITVAAAEHLAAWLAGRALNPEVRLTGGMWAGVLDMRTGHVSYSSFDAMFYGCATAEFLRCWCHVEVAVGGGEYCDAKLPGMYAALEKAYKSMTIAAFTGRHPELGHGLLDEGKSLSAVELLLERDLAGGIAQFGREIAPTADNLALSGILEVGLGLDANHLGLEHTARNFRSCLWLPTFIERSGWNGFDQERQMLDRIQDQVNALTAEYHKPDDRADKLAAMRAIVERAAQSLLP